MKYFVVAVVMFLFYPLLCVHTDPQRFQKLPFFCKYPLWRAFFKTSMFVRTSVNGFTKADIFFSVFVKNGRG